MHVKLNVCFIVHVFRAVAQREALCFQHFSRSAHKGPRLESGLGRVLILLSLSIHILHGF